EDLHVPDGDVAVGMRPEALRPVGHDYLGPCFEILVDVVEPLGDEVLVHGSVDASPVGVLFVADADDATLLADINGNRAKVALRLPPKERPTAGSRLRVAVAQADIRLFDMTSGLAIRPA